eukprot:TRINITY_DN5861_c0_g1_i10.p1 TRINITY_DN5861_c0_g1~~TRINITY_DN5861_c0_g1_i10.p1  ORF type:complete len:141 (-),score=24.58 TRINITY_DN5861_c0_g1_i10:13-435(-)
MCSSDPTGAANTSGSATAAAASNGPASASTVHVAPAMTNAAGIQHNLGLLRRSKRLSVGIVAICSGISFKSLPLQSRTRRCCNCAKCSLSAPKSALCDKSSCVRAVSEKICAGTEVSVQCDLLWNLVQIVAAAVQNTEML